MNRLIEPEYIQRAKDLLADQLGKHPDANVRFLASITELSDSDPRVIQIAQALSQGGKK